MEVLQQYGNQNHAMSVTLCNTCLETLSGYADWIDISFMTNPLTLQILFGLLENENYAENVLLCFEELINNTIKYPTQLRVGFIFGYFLSTIPGVPYTCSLLEPRLLLTTVPVSVIRSPVLDHMLYHHIGLYVSLGLQGLTGGQ